ncbi:MAG TPA: magnesium chelatase [Firmicutes bacterium]|jgi:MoxR-like ATPase|nr:magnesium chelatase [Bacillota bacterium]
MEKVQSFCEQVKSELAKVIVGQEDVIEGLLIALFVGGHVLLEGPPGVAKTLIAKSFARVLSADYKRVQFTPDLMPLDITGTNIFDHQRQQFSLRPGPIFTDILLADEINRTPPKTQAALLEAMEEKQVTIDGELKALSGIFTVLATQNPLEYEGTYPLPEAQLDRFLLKLQLSYPDSATEIAIYQRYQEQLVGDRDLEKIRPVLDPNGILEIRRMVASVTVRPDIIDYIYQIIKATRENSLLILGASPRAGIYLLHAAKGYAAFCGRDYVIPDDIQEVVYMVLSHRVLVKPEALIDGKSSDAILQNIVNNLKVPR